MFIGHFGVGMAAKPAARRTSLGTLFLACQFLDLLWPTLVLLGIEKVEVAPGATRLTPLEFVYYPFSHSLLAALVWSALFGLVYFVIRRDPKGSLVCAALVTSHWLLDVLVHKPDLPLSPGSTVKIGLGLWNLRSAPISISA
jgi:membrane-bound metal-dependent hydrolase YbcI (DUF457 family)